MYEFVKSYTRGLFSAAIGTIVRQFWPIKFGVGSVCEDLFVFTEEGRFLSQKMKT